MVIVLDVNGVNIGYFSKDVTEIDFIKRLKRTYFQNAKVGSPFLGTFTKSE